MRDGPHGRALDRRVDRGSLERRSSTSPSASCCGPRPPRTPDAVALMAGAPDPEARRRWTYGELLEQSERAARAPARAASPRRARGGLGQQPPRVGDPRAGRRARRRHASSRSTRRCAPASSGTCSASPRADGIFLVAEYRGTPMAEMLDARPRRAARAARGRLVLRLGRVLRERARRPRDCRDVDPRRPGADPVHVGHDRPCPRARCCTTAAS